jgi:hypothetical protein
MIRKLLVWLGLRWPDGKVEYDAPLRFQVMLRQQLHSAERKLGRLHSGAKIKILIQPATAASKGMWGVPHPDKPNAVLGGRTFSKRKILLYANGSGDLHKGATEHEMAHCVLKSVGYKYDHHELMRKCGIHMGDN